ETSQPSGARAKNERSASVQGSQPRETIERRAASENPLRATTINDFEKLGTALGGTPTIVERLPSRAAERRCSRQDAVRVCPPPSRELKPPAPGRAASASAVGSAL